MTINQVIKTIFNVLYQIVSTAVIVIGMIVGIMYLCGIRLYHVKSGSMGDLLPVGCVCLVSIYTPYDTITVGDVISFRISDDMLVTHRAIQITEDGITTQGDENENPDPDFVTKENYIGKTVMAVPYIGGIFSFFHTEKGVIALCAGIVCLLIAGLFYRNKTE